MRIAEPIQVYFVTYIDDDGGERQDAFVTATTPEEAFALWRQDWLGHSEDDYRHMDLNTQVSVWTVPEASAKVGVMDWPAPGEAFNLNHVSLTTMAATTVGE